MASTIHLAASEEKRNSLHKLMLAQHENAIDSSDDDDDEDDDDDDDDSQGGIPAWLAMRHSQLKKDMLSKAKVASLPSSACATAGPSRHSSDGISAGLACLNTRTQDATANIEDGSESSRDTGEPTPTESEFHPSSYQENESPSSIPPYSTGASTFDVSNPAKPGSYDYVEYYSGSCKVMRGGFAYATENARPKVLSEPFRAFPPLSNRGYMLTSTGHDPKFVHRAEPVNSTFIPRSCIKALLLDPRPKSTPQPPVEPLPTKDPIAEGAWVDLESEVLETSSTGGVQPLSSPSTEFMHCRKCGEDHIPPGSLLSLAQRDTCGSYLPDWFPAEELEHPWVAFTDLNNEILRLENLERGYTTLPKVWNRVYHEEHPVWKTLGRRGGGWWRCRTGPNVPQAERKCHECHIRFPEVLRPNTETMDSAMRNLGRYRNFVKGHMDRIGQQDKAFALEMIRETMQSHTFQPCLRAVGIGRADRDEKDNKLEEEQPLKSNQRMVLEAMWDHQGPISSLDIPPGFTFDYPAHDVDDADENEEETFLTMKSIVRRRPPPLSFHRQTSSLGSNFFSSTISPMTPLTPSSPDIPEEEI